uniref:Cilia and flagella associated protein 74 n=1 Tax=Crocodylus porosus TaxID=8502 RepID=A0A7M4F678_CROPO
MDYYMLDGIVVFIDYSVFLQVCCHSPHVCLFETMFRLQAVHSRLCTELENEKDLEPKIALLLKENVYDMWQIEIEQGKFGGLREQLEKDEETLERQYKKRTEERIQKEKAKVLLMEQKERAGKKKEMESQEEYEQRHQKVIEDAQRNNEKAVQFYSTYRIYQKKAKEELETREHMERRMQAVLSLKNNITSNRVQVLKTHYRALTFLLIFKYREFKDQQKSKKIEIVARILQEEAYMQKQEKSRSCTEAVRSCSKLQDSALWRIKTWHYIEKTCEDPAAAVLQVSRAIMPCKVSKEETDLKPHGASKMEREIFTQNLKKLRSGMIHKQVVSGHEFKGCPFYSKPSVIHFKDFDVGKTYKKKIILINASYSVNFCKLVGVSEHLKDFISIHFDPPGQMSAGMSCEMVVTFKPMINEALEGEVTFLAQTGSFSIPLKCTIKRCVLALDKELIDFGTHVVGETISRTITLTNRGALGTRFKLQMSSLEESWSGSSKRLPREVVDSPSLEVFKTQLDKALVTEGEIGPFSSVKLQVIFLPAIPGEVQAEFVFTFDNQNSNPLFFTAIGVSVDVPVWVTNPNVDLKICMYDRLYQDCIIIQTKTALRLKFEVCKELSKYMELLPKTGYIQAQSSFSVQLKFLPRRSLPEDAGGYFDKETRVLEVPMTISVADKIKPATFTVHAIVTTSDLEISPAEVNFGYCTIYETLQTSITLTNKSILPQEFGFVDLPEFVEVQPNDGFGTLLPLESLNLDIFFKAKKAKDYSFELICKTEINRQFKLSCKAVGVHPPLELSHSLVQFAATALNDVSTATLYVINSHVSLNRFTHAVPRIGKGQTAPVGPTSFEFHVPESSPVTVIPSVGTVLPGKKCLIQVSFRPVLSDQQIRKEAVQMLSKATATRTFSEKRMRESEMHINVRNVKTNISEEYMAAQSSLIRNFRGQFEKYIIPCFVASGDIDEKGVSETLNYSPYNTLYLELHCPAVAPSVVITSDNGKNIINFGEVAVGHRITKQITIQNVSDEQLAIGFSILNPHGPFLLVNPVGSLQPGENQLLVISFCPDENKLFFETLDICTIKNTLTLSITGHGVTPSIACSVEGEILDMGYVIAKEKGTSTFKIQNTSTLALKYSMQLESLSQTRNRDLQKLPSFLTSPTKRTELVGTQNYSGLSVFSVFPVEGVIDIGKSQDFTVTFSPDHESLYYSDCLKVMLFGKEIAHVIQLKGAARNHMMFVEGGDPLDVPIESLVVTLPISEEAGKRDLEETVKSILLSLECIQGETSPTPAIRELKVGAIGASQFASKKPAHPLTATATLTLKGDIKETYKVLFMARVVSALTH